MEWLVVNQNSSIRNQDCEKKPVALADSQQQRQHHAGRRIPDHPPDLGDHDDLRPIEKQKHHYKEKSKPRVTNRYASSYGLPCRRGFATVVATLLHRARIWTRTAQGLASAVIPDLRKPSMCHRHARDRVLLAQLIEDMGLPSSATSN